MKKILVLICLLFLTGCTVNYEITIGDNGIKEKATLIETNKALFDVRNDSGWTLRESFNALVEQAKDEFSVEDYSMKSLNSEDQLGVQYKSNDINSLKHSFAINQCYNNPTMVENGNIITFSTGNDFKCYEYYDNLETIKIVLKTNYKVISSNAEIVDGNKYIWNITKDGNKQIEISYDKSVNKAANFVLIISIIFVVAALCFATYYIYSKKKKENKV